MNVMGDVIFDTEKTGGRSRWPNNIPGFFPELRSPSAGWQLALVSFSQSAVMSCFAQNYTASHKKKLHHDIYFCMGGPLYIVELSDSEILRA